MATQQQIQNIITRLAPYAQKYSKKYGYAVCSPCIAQALQESLGKYEGLSYLAYKYNNIHGIKAYPKWTGSTVNMKTGEEYTPGQITTISSNFCVFNNEEDGIEQYYLFLERNPRYKNLKQCMTAESYIQTIRSDGYCTSNSYVVNCIDKINRYNLKQYDSADYVPERYTVGLVYTTKVNLYVRDKASGDKVKFDSLTQDAKSHSKFDDFGYGILDKGTRVTCKAIEKIGNAYWLQIPSGWICAITESGEVYVE